MSFPTVAAALWGLQEVITFRLVVKSAVDFEVVEDEAGGDIFGGGGMGAGGFSDPGAQQGTFVGTLEPLRPWKIQAKPEGQRTWKFWTLWTTTLLNLDDVIVDSASKRYRVMEKRDWNQGGYYEYEVSETFDQAAG